MMNICIELGVAGITLTDFINLQPNLDFDRNMITNVINN